MKSDHNSVGYVKSKLKVIEAIQTKLAEEETVMMLRLKHNFNFVAERVLGQILAPMKLRAKHEYAVKDLELKQVKLRKEFETVQKSSTYCEKMVFVLVDELSRDLNKTINPFKFEVNIIV